TERGHHVIDSGPYAIVRHPGYAGAVLAWIAAPVALHTLWALLPACPHTDGVGVRCVDPIQSEGANNDVI
ncbi:MAG: hypothetical protein GYB64_13035, partial [Chloroflexi bacterium]|nr:hypothetical protein [Chloroflexota bacterium]